MFRFSDLGLGILDRWILGGSILAIGGSSVLLVQDRVLREWAGFRTESRESIGEFVSVNQDVRRRVGNSMAWFPALDREALFENDSIFTGENSEASVRFKEGLEIGLSSNSLVVLRRQSKDVFLDLRLGGVIATLKKGASIKVREGNSVAVLEGSQGDSKVKLHRSKKGHISVTAFDSQVQMRLNDSGKNIAANSAIEVDNGGVLKEISHSVRLISPILGNKIWLAPDDMVKFSWDQTGSRKALYRIQISTDEDFNKSLVQEMVPTTSYATKELNQEGTYYWRIQSRRDATSEWKEESRVAQFSVFRKAPPHPYYPFEGLNIVTRGHPAEIKFEWEEKPEVENYRFQVATDEQFQAMVQNEVVTDHFMAGIQLQPGPYHWRVRAEGVSPVGDGWSEVIHFGVDRKAEAIVDPESLSAAPLGGNEPALTPPAEEAPVVVEEKSLQGASKPVAQPLLAPKLVTPNIEMVLEFPQSLPREPAAAAQVKPVNPPALIWQPVVGAQLYDVEISPKENFSTQNYAASGKGTKLTWTGVEPGYYFWRVRARAPKSRSPLSDVGKIQVGIPASRGVLSKNLTQAVNSPEEVKTKAARYNWTWDPVPLARAYDTYLSQNPDFAGKVKSSRVEKAQMVTRITPGNNFLKVVAIGGARGSQELVKSPSSPVGKIVLKNKFVLQVPEIQGPDNGLTMISFGAKTDPIAFTWNSVPHGTLYRIQTSADVHFRKVIKEEKVEGTDLVLASEDFSGRIYWRIRAEHDEYVSAWTSVRYFTIKK